MKKSEKIRLVALCFDTNSTLKSEYRITEQCQLLYKYKKKKPWPHCVVVADILYYTDDPYFDVL